ncbi:phosphatase family protein [Metarhizium album ARSEF 1941]|uniref:Phosphatase family protein n=1 Tax=Metarhizium album (strain ARSEF 1941) TaxID=1081103 RepID=A0A0B2WML7_METAS|nr:phosphatase family protein [Metarhizium album ARSEF 1941]KHN97281.1 phosphatase family protein [Metarhizium album ARSEF 1941]
MTWGNQHSTSKCSVLHRNAIRCVTERCLDLLYCLRDLALQYASPDGVAYVAGQTQLPPPDGQEQDQLSEPCEERGYSSRSPWLEDLRLDRQWQDEQTYALCNTWFASIDRHQEARASLSACKRGEALAAALDVALDDALHRTTDAYLLAPFDDSFAGKLAAVLQHLSHGCCCVGNRGGSAESKALRSSPEGAVLATRHFIEASHLQQLQREIESLAQYLLRMLAEAKARREAQMLKQSRWVNRQCTGGRAGLMKSSGLGSPLREVCDSDHDWRRHRAGVPSRVVLVARSEQQVGQQVNSQGSCAEQQETPEKTWGQNTTCW